jgi:hypothetical protein
MRSPKIPNRLGTVDTKVPNSVALMEGRIGDNKAGAYRLFTRAVKDLRTKIHFGRNLHKHNF